MPQSLAQILLHITFSTKNREPFIQPDAFSLGMSQLDTVKKYVGRQKEHHWKKTFQEEYLELLKKYKVEYDERYVWD